MKCISPLNIKNPDEELSNTMLQVPCGKCYACLSKKRSDWSFRLEQEYKVCQSAYFITLTYSEENIILADTIPTLVRNEISQFIKKVRNSDRQNKNIKYYGVGEYGTKTERPHYHVILFNLSKKAYEKLETIWHQGHIYIGTVTSASINYVTKYMITKQKDYEDRVPEYSSMSKQLGIDYLKENEKYHIETENQTVRLNNGRTIGIPQYYKNKIFSKYDKQKYTERTRIQMLKADIAYEEYLKTKSNKNPEKTKIEQINNNITILKKRLNKHENGNI